MNIEEHIHFKEQVYINSSLDKARGETTHTLFKAVNSTIQW